MDDCINYRNLFGELPIFGMIHLAGQRGIVKRALEEVDIYQEEGVDGVIVENYHGPLRAVGETLQELSNRDKKPFVGVNVLPNEFVEAFELARRYGAEFIQLDHVAGEYSGRGSLDTRLPEYLKERTNSKGILVLGGVWPKYYLPTSGSNLERDLHKGVGRADAIVVTGEGTGEETPLSKIERFRDIIGRHPLVVGAGLTPRTAYEKLSISDGAIVGSAFKIDNDTRNELDRKRIKDFMDVVRQVRDNLV